MFSIDNLKFQIEKYVAVQDNIEDTSSSKDKIYQIYPLIL